MMNWLASAVRVLLKRVDELERTLEVKPNLGNDVESFVMSKKTQSEHLPTIVISIYGALFEDLEADVGDDEDHADHDDDDYESSEDDKSDKKDDKKAVAEDDKEDDKKAVAEDDKRTTRRRLLKTTTRQLKARWTRWTTKRRLMK